MQAQAQTLAPFFSTGAAREHDYRQLVKPPLLVAYGLMANALFWSGLVMPYGVNAPSHIAYLHVFSVAVGFAMAFGGATATLMIVSRKKSVPLRSVEFLAGLLNISVLTASATLLLSVVIRSL